MSIQSGNGKGGTGGASAAFGRTNDILGLRGFKSSHAGLELYRYVGQ